MLTPDPASPVSSAAHIEEGWTAVDGVRTRYLRAGSGPPLILLHGLLGYSFSWRFNIEAFARYRTVYAVDMPGAGFSEGPNNLDCTFRGAAVRFLQFADNLGLSAFDLLATSHGGAVAMHAAALVNQGSRRRVRSLILVAPVNPWSDHGRVLAPFLSGALVSGLLGWCLPHLSFTRTFFLRRLYGDPARISPGTVEGYSKPLTRARSFDYFFKILRTWNHDLEELESSLTEFPDIPILLVWGTRDAAVDPDSAQILARHFRNCEVVKFPGVGHLPYEEVPQEFNAAVIEFLSKLAQVGTDAPAVPPKK